MSTASAYLTVGGIEVDVVYKDIKNLHVGVYPPLGRVRVAAPKWLDDEQVRLAVIRRLQEVQVADAGHMLHHDQPEILADIIETFLD